MIAALLVAVISTMPQARELVAEVRVHGNVTLSDEAVLQLAGVAIGTPLDAAGTTAVEQRLRDSGRFDEVQVRKRYRTLAMDDVALVLIVHERAGLSASGQPPSVLRRVRNRLMFFPILHYDDGYGWTYGGQTAIVNALGKGTRLSVPLSWGATRRAAVEADRTFKSGPLTRLTGSFGVVQRENPHFNIDDRRTAVSARAERRLLSVVTLGGEVGRTQVTFRPLHDSFWSTGADATVDTRRDPTFPSDAVMATAGWTRLHPIGLTAFNQNGGSVDRYRLDARGFKRLFRQNVVAVRAEYDSASAPLPAYEQWLLGGSNLRGVRSGAYAGDQRFLWSAELRVPFSSPLSLGRIGFNVFMDGGVTAAHGERVWDQPRHKSAGAGLFLIATVLQLNLDVSRSIDGKSTRVHFGTGFSF
ncbi:MAG: FtsQ-type POTRA domain-containing protein [Vicinamibacterales bacterium]